LMTIVLFGTGLVSLQLLLVFLAVSFGLNMVVRVSSLILDLRFHGDVEGRRSAGEVLTLCGLALLEYPVFRPVILLARIAAFFEFRSGHRGWEKVERKSNGANGRQPARTAEPATT